MPHKSLKSIEREQKREVSRAARWTARHGVGSLPGRRLPSGESATRERSTLLTGRTGIDPAAGQLRAPSTHHTVSLDALSSMERLEQSQWFEPLVGHMPGQSPRLSGDDLERRDRLEHVMSFLLPEHAELLLERHAERRTLDAIAKDRCVTRQAIIKRLRTAEQDFRKFFGLHYWDYLSTVKGTDKFTRYAADIMLVGMMGVG